MSAPRFTRWAQISAGQRVEIRTRNRSGLVDLRYQWVRAVVEWREGSRAEVVRDGRTSSIRTVIYLLTDIRPAQHDPRQEPRP
jgi:hypothetical protein